MTLLEVDGLTKVFRARGRQGLRRRLTEHCAVDDVSFELGRGETLAVVGESGAGKSTVARLVLRLLDADAGTVRFDGIELMTLGREALRERRRHMQMIFQDPYSSLDPRIPIGRSVAEPLRVHTRLNRADRERLTVALLERVGLGRHHVQHYPSELSGGQLQRVSIARALTVEPKLIVCDEAVAALDVSVRAQVLNLLADLQDEKRLSYLFIAHDLAIVEAFADRVLVMKDGRVVDAGSTAEVFASPSSTYTTALLAAVPDPDPRSRTAAAAGLNQVAPS